MFVFGVFVCFWVDKLWNLGRLLAVGKAGESQHIPTAEPEQMTEASW